MSGTKNVGEIVRAIRKQKGKTATFIAKKLGYKSVSSYTRIEKGVTELTFEMALKLADALEVDISQLSDANVLRDSRNNVIEEQAASSA